MAERLSRWEGRNDDGPRAVLVKRDNFNSAMQEALRKLARLEDAEEAARPIERDTPGDITHHEPPKEET